MYEQLGKQRSSSSSSSSNCYYKWRVLSLTNAHLSASVVTSHFHRHVHLMPWSFSLINNWEVFGIKGVKVTRDRDPRKGRQGGQLHRTLHCYRPDHFCITMDSDESHFNVSILVSGKLSHETIKCTFRASVSGTFLQIYYNRILHWRGTRSLSPRSCPPTLSASSERFIGINKTVEAT